MTDPRIASLLATLDRMGGPINLRVFPPVPPTPQEKEADRIRLKGMGVAE